mgnify:CR=1 FL=1
MKGIIKRLMVSALLVITMCAVIGCSRQKKEDFIQYLNNTLEYFINSSGFSLKSIEEGVYENEEQTIKVKVKNNLVHSIELTGNVEGYVLGKLSVGEKKKSVEKKIKSTYTATPEVTEHKEDETTLYAYQSGNRMLSIKYNKEQIVESIMIEATNYTVGSVTENVISSVEVSKDQVMISVGNIDVSYSEAMVYLRTAQEFYETEFDNSVWGYDLQGDGTTIGSVLKQEVLNQIIQLEIMNAQANEQGITLSDDEMLEVKAVASEYLASISEADKIKYGLTEDLTVRVFAANALAKKVYETVTIDVDTNVSDEEAKQIRIYKLFLKTYGEDSKGNRTQLRESDLDEIKKKMKELRNEAKNVDDFYSFAEANSNDEVVEYVVGHGDLPEAYEQVAFSLKTGQISKIIETEDGLAILYCADDYEEDKTLQVKEEIIEQRREALFMKLYSEWIKHYDVRVNMSLWNQLELNPIEKK